MAQKTPEKTNHPNLIARELPRNVEAEQAVLGCVIIDEYAPSYVLSELNEADFYSPAHRNIFAAMKSIILADKPVDLVTLVDELEVMGELKSAGGLTYLTTLTNIVPSAANYSHYAQIVKKNSQLRSLIHSAQKITDKAFTGDPDGDALKFAEAEIFSLAEKNDRSGLEEIKKPVSQAIDRMELLYSNPNMLRGIPTGFKRLDDLLGGFQKSDLILIAARPGQGKTSIGMNFIQNVSLASNRRTAAGKPDPYKCAVFSLEMPADQLAKRMICSLAKVNMKNAGNGQLQSADWVRIHDAKAKLEKAHIYIDDSSLNTPIEILSKCRRLKREKGLDIVMVDYLQLMSAGKRTESRQQEISEITRTMKIAAKELGVPILLLSQMSREVEKRKDKKPQMSDLRESGAIEQDADIIMFIHREYDANDVAVDEQTRNKVELIIEKHRNGEKGKIDMRWRGEYVSFEEVVHSPSLEKNAPPEDKGGGTFVMGGDLDAADDKTSMSSLSAEEIMNVKPSDEDNIF